MSHLWAAEVCYRERFHRFGGLVDLGPDGANLIDGNLASGKSSGYRFEISADNSKFRIWTWPEVYGETGVRSLYLDQTGMLRRSWDKQRADASSPVVGPMPGVVGCQAVKD